MNEPLRQRMPVEKCKPFLEFLRTQRCCIPGCRRHDIEAAHVSYADAEHLAIGKRSRGRSEKSSDRWAVPLCAGHHRLDKDAQHNMSERAFWQMHGLDPIELAQNYWKDLFR